MIKTNETQFTKENLIKDGMYLLFGTERKFVARFKYRLAPVTMAKFRKELIANHNPESYFADMESGKTPLGILKEANPLWYSKIMNAFALSV
jgi:hypothetical protein